MMSVNEFPDNVSWDAVGLSEEKGGSTTYCGISPAGKPRKERYID
jgi:hypothetical protein